MSLNLLYLSNDPELDLLIFKKVVPFFKSKNSFENSSNSKEYIFVKYEQLPDNLKRIFRDLVYEQYNDLDCSKQEFLQLYEFVVFVGYNKREFLPLYRRYLYNHRDDKEFMKVTVHIHRNAEWLEIDKLSLYCMLSGIDPKFTLEEIKNSDNPDIMYIYAYCTQYGIGGEIDEKNARELYLNNWKKNRHNDSLHNYALCLQHGRGGEIDEKEARRLYFLSWKQYRNNHSLNSYAECLEHGIGGEDDENRAKKLYRKNWENNRDSDSLHNYAFCLQNSGFFIDAKKARELYIKNWEENKYISSLYQYLFCLERGLGGERDLLKHAELKQIYLEFIQLNQT